MNAFLTDFNWECLNSGNVQNHWERINLETAQNQCLFMRFHYRTYPFRAGWLTDGNQCFSIRVLLGSYQMWVGWLTVQNQCYLLRDFHWEHIKPDTLQNEAFSKTFPLRRVLMSSRTPRIWEPENLSLGVWESGSLGKLVSTPDYERIGGHLKSWESEKLRIWKNLRIWEVENLRSWESENLRIKEPENLIPLCTYAYLQSLEAEMLRVRESESLRMQSDWIRKRTYKISESEKLRVWQLGIWESWEPGRFWGSRKACETLTVWDSENLSLRAWESENPIWLCTCACS